MPSGVTLSTIRFWKNAVPTATTEPACGETAQGAINVEGLADSLHDPPGLALAWPGKDRDIILTDRRLFCAVIAVGRPEGNLDACRVVSELLTID